MKKCPVCEKTFEDSMRFCQSDGTPLVEDALPLDPYKTMVASKEEIMAAMPKPIPPPAEPVPEEEVLQLPVESDPLKTMYASEDEIRREMDKQSPPEENVIDLPPLAPEPPKFNEPKLTPPVFKDAKDEEPAGERSPFDSTPPLSPFEMTTPPVPSPFGKQVMDDEPKPPVFDPPKPNFPAFAESEPVLSEPLSNPFDNSSAPPVWNPPAAPDASWQNQEIGKDTPFQPPVNGDAGPSSVLAFVSLGLGIVGLLAAILTLIFSLVPLLIVICGTVPFLLGVGAVITGFLARSRAKSMPDKYGGGGIALVGLILGVLDIIAPFVLVGLWLLLWGGFALLS